MFRETLKEEEWRSYGFVSGGVTCAAAEFRGCRDCRSWPMMVF